MTDLLLYLKGSYLTVALLILLTILVVAIYDNITQQEYTIEVYLSYALLVGFVSTLVVYINTIPQPLINEEIIKGPPNF